MPLAAKAVFRCLNNRIRITTRSPQGSPRLTERGRVFSLPNLTAYFWRGAAREHRELKFESTRRHSRLFNGLLNPKCQAKFPGSREIARDRRLNVFPLAPHELGGSDGTRTRGLLRERQAPQFLKPYRLIFLRLAHALPFVRIGFPPSGVSSTGFLWVLAHPSNGCTTRRSLRNLP